MQNQWTYLVEANLEELMTLRLELQILDSHQLQFTYATVLYHFLKNETQELESFIASLETEKIPADLWQLMQIRLQYRKLTLSLPQTEAISKEVSAQEMSLFKAESLFVLALSFQRHKFFAQAKQNFEMASEIYRRHDALKKSVRCWGNAIAALSCLHPESFLIQEYNSLYNKSFEIEEWPGCVSALTNLSREYQRMGALTFAYEKIQEAQSIAERYMFFSREHHLALLQKAHILFNLQRLAELETLLPILAKSPFQEVSSSTEVLIAKMRQEDIQIKEHVLPTWVERASENKEFDIKNQLETIEAEMIRLLALGPQTKEELIHKLYGDRIDFLNLENRFKNILSRARKKWPGRIILNNEKYEWVDIVAERKSKA